MGRALIVAAAIALAASAAPAATPHGSWRGLHDLAGPASEVIAGAPGLTGEAHAWGDPSAGCFGIVQELRTDHPVAHPTTAISELHTSIHEGLAAGGASFESWNAERNVSTGRFQRGDLDAQIRSIASIDPAGALTVRSAVCFYNERDAERSRDRCKRFLETL